MNAMGVINTNIKNARNIKWKRQKKKRKKWMKIM